MLNNKKIQFFYELTAFLVSAKFYVSFCQKKSNFLCSIWPKYLFNPACHFTFIGIGCLFGLQG